MFERWNTHLSTSVSVELFGIDVRMSQDPSSMNLGTTVWDASIVLAKFLEKNARKGEFSRANVKGKRAIELGAGPGLGGMAFALLGADVLLTDLADIVPLIRKNVDANFTSAALHGREGPWGQQVGKLRVQELDWGTEAHIIQADGPFAFVLAADCVYHEEHIFGLRQTILALTDLKSTVIIANELRSESVQAQFMMLFEESFTACLSGP
ncbi:g4011 [Coccomyxa elongata]